MREITQEQFNQAAAIFDQIDALKDKKRMAGTLQEKLNIQFEISRLIQRRLEILECQHDWKTDATGLIDTCACGATRA